MKGDVEEALGAGAAGFVDDDERLRHQVMLLHNALDHAGHLIGAAAGAGRDDEFDRARRLPRGGGGRQQRRDRQGGGRAKMANMFLMSYHNFLRGEALEGQPI